MRQRSPGFNHVEITNLDGNLPTPILILVGFGFDVVVIGPSAYSQNRTKHLEKCFLVFRDRITKFGIGAHDV
jgi:hypothetical protein